MSGFSIDEPLTQVEGIGRFLPKLKRLGITTVENLLAHFPVRYEDFSQIYKIADLIPNQEATIQGRIEEIDGRRAWRRRNLYIVECLISDDTGTIKAVWFNQPYIRNVLQPGRIANFSGKVSLSGEEIHLSNPTYELITNDSEQITKHTARIVPVYPETKGLTSKGIRYLMKPVLDNLEKMEEYLPEEILKEHNFPEINRALQDIHFPSELREALAAKERFEFEDLLLLQLFNLKQKIALAQNEAPKIKVDVDYIKKLLGKLPFTLTLSQKKSLWEILKDTEKGVPMNRLLQGDVGSGKTIIAALAALNAAKNGYQTALMAPTEILARQHFNTLVKFFPEFDGGVAFINAAGGKIFYGHELSSEMSKKQVQNEIKSGKIKITVGTHALIQKNVEFSNLGLVIIDEQHRFGVKQRAELLKNNEAKSVSPRRLRLGRRPGDSLSGDTDFAKNIPHFLSMSATPIPRTLSLTIFGDLDLSVVTEMPKNRKPIITKAIEPSERMDAYKFVRNEIKKGRQVFVVCPRIEPTEKNEQVFSRFEWQKLEMKSVKEEYEKLSKKIFPDLKILMLHGKMKSAEKEKIMSAFANASADKREKVDILITTSVVEVGVDVPNATVMLIEGAERFGLAQLYQFRGRVGRGEHQSYCLLFSDSSSQLTKQRLKSIIEAKNGFELAEKDLKIRGPGEFFGQSQTGMPDLAMKALQNPGIIKESREAAVRIIKDDPLLKKYPVLNRKISEFQKQIHWE
ncbi:MAG: ATP-dependent DNA helicase RecG [Minisyncoccia bacterium]